LFLCLAIIPASISSLKSVTNTYCPWDITRYGGDQPYVKAIDSYPPGFTQKSKAKCFPSGHASGGFALFSLCLIAKRRRTFFAFMILALTVGWTMGLYQMFKGAHYLTHNLATMFLSWIMCMAIYLPFAKSIPHRENS
jgi:membrane-associated PAP2 superfamily phosphatase